MKKYKTAPAPQEKIYKGFTLSSLIIFASVTANKNPSFSLLITFLPQKINTYVFFNDNTQDSFSVSGRMSAKIVCVSKYPTALQASLP